MNYDPFTPGSNPSLAGVSPRVCVSPFVCAMKNDLSPYRPAGARKPQIAQPRNSTARPARPAEALPTHTHLRTHARTQTLSILVRGAHDNHWDKFDWCLHTLMRFLTSRTECLGVQVLLLGRSAADVLRAPWHRFEGSLSFESSLFSTSFWRGCAGPRQTRERLMCVCVRGDD